MYEFSKILTLQQPGHFFKFVFIYCTDIIMSTMVSRINSPAIVYSAAHSRADKKHIKAPRHWPLWGGFTGDRRIPRIIGQLHG